MDGSKYWNLSPTTISLFVSSDIAYSRLGGVTTLSLTLYAQVCGFDPGASRWIFMKQKIDSVHVKNQATAMRICLCWIQEETTARWAQSHPPRCTTVRDDRRIVRVVVIDHADPSIIIAQHSLLRIIRCPLVPFVALCSKVECSWGVHCFVCP
ncbi:UNVERIFIED_CONTAM: hypothetical protein NCL1_38547 [Trichonephila clavipes]